MTDFPKVFNASAEDAGMRLDQFLTSRLPEVSRARIQQLISDNQVRVNDTSPKASLRLRGNERIEVLGAVQVPPLRAIAENIPLDIIYEDDDLAVINKPAGMMVHAGAGATDSARNRGTLVNALLHHFQSLSQVGGVLRPGIVHRLDRETSGLIVVAKNDEAHRRLAAQFARREAKKTYIALVHGSMKQDRGTVRSSISRDPVHRTRMTTRVDGGREAITHYLVRKRMETPFGKFSLLDVKIDTGRTHQIRVHLSALRHPIVGDKLYGAPELQVAKNQRSPIQGALRAPKLERNFLHSAELMLKHPRTDETLSFRAQVPGELEAFLKQLQPA